MGNNSDRARLPTLLRVLGWGLGAFTVLLVVLVLIVELMSWNFLKGPITERIETTTGREMKISGDVSVSLLPYPQLSLSGLKLANPDGAQYPQMLTIDHLEIEPSLTNFGQQFFLDAEARLGIADEQKLVPLKLSATVDPGFTGSAWQLRDIQAQVGEVLITGNLGVDAGATQTVVTGKLHSPSINVSNILVTLPKSRSAAPTTLSIPVLPSLAGEIRLTVSEIILKPATFNNVEASIRLGLNEFVLETLNFSVASGKGEASARLISNAEFITLETRLDLYNIDLQGIDLRALGLTELPGQIVSAELDLALDEIQQSPSLTLRTLLEHVDIGVAKASYRTKEHESGAATHLELALQEVGKPPIPTLTVNGPFRGKPLDMTIEGAPLPQLADYLTDYGLQAQAQSGELLAWVDTRLGALLRPTSFAGNLVLEADGSKDLEAWTGATLPPLPEFRLSGRLSRDGKLWSATSLDGRIGVTELSGEVHFRRAERSGNRTKVNVDLQAGRLKLAQFMGKREPTGVHSEAHSGESAGATDRSPLSALRALDGQLNLRADTLVLPDTPELKDLRLVANMDSGELEVEPLEFNVAGGRWESSLTLDATKPLAIGTLEANFEGIALSQFGRTFTLGKRGARP